MMKIKIIGSIFGVALVLALAFTAVADMSNFKASQKVSPSSEVLGPGGKSQKCTTIQGGELVASDGTLIETGYDEWGYNYQALMFNGKYCDAYRDAAWCQDYKEDELMMKWNEAWLSNKDCDGDGKLDRHFGFTSYIGSGAWLTNHQAGTYEQDGETCKWTYFVKIVAAPADATSTGGVWNTADGVEIGQAIWGEFAVTQEVYNDQCTGEHGVLYKGEAPTGFGFYKP